MQKNTVFISVKKFQELNEELADYKAMLRNTVDQLSRLSDAVSDYLDDKCEEDIRLIGEITSTTQSTINRFENLIDYGHDLCREEDARVEYEDRRASCVKDALEEEAEGKGDE